MPFRTCFPLLLAALVLAGCAKQDNAAETAPPTRSSPATADDVKRETKEAWQTIGAYAAGKKDEYTQAMEKKIAALNQDLSGLKSNTAQASAEAKLKANVLLAETQKKLETAQHELTEFKNAHTNQWQAVKDGVDKGVQDLQQSLEKLRDALK